MTSLNGKMEITGEIKNESLKKNYLCVKIFNFSHLFIEFYETKKSELFDGCIGLFYIRSL